MNPPRLPRRRYSLVDFLSRVQDTGLRVIVCMVRSIVPIRRMSCCLGLILILSGRAVGAPVAFNREVRPILAEHCFACHGPDAQQRKAGLRLDLRDGATVRLKSGATAVVPGDPLGSALIHRIDTLSADDLMPPPEFQKPLTTREKDTLRRWIQEGATYEIHWALLPPQRVDPPAVQLRRWPRNPVDHFVLAQLEARKWTPSPEADRPTLLRRLSLDLTGLPPTPAERDAFLADRSPRAYERVVDRLLSSEHYGERMAVDWLDAARFADSNGYQVDRDREAYPWRDWVIRAFNANLPFDRFTLEQIAGDLLPQPTLDQRIATGFHRNHIMNEEGGVIPEEFLAEYCADRVETTAAVWLGQTFNCARCHDHKFDPFTQRDYYSLLAFFHNVTEKGIGDYGANIRRNNPPMLKLPAPELATKLSRLKADLGEAESSQTAARRRVKAEESDWNRRFLAALPQWHEPVSLRQELAGQIHTLVPPGKPPIAPPALTNGTHRWTLEATFPKPGATALRLEVRAPGNTNESLVWPVRGITGEIWSASSGAGSPPGWVPLPLRVGDAEGCLASGEVGTILDPKAAKPVKLTLRGDAPARLCLMLEARHRAAAEVRIRLTGEGVVDRPTPPAELRLTMTAAAGEFLVPTAIAGIARKEPFDRTAAEAAQLADYRANQDVEYRTAASRVAQLRSEVDQTDLQIPTALVMDELPTPRPTYVLIRGSYQNRGDQVNAATPAVLPAMAPNLPRNRLGLARWLVDRANPLPARVTVNRLWQSFFGTGLVATAEDFGSKGEPPTHPELLDWLATEFIRTGWDVKHMVRLLVTSATYRQSSRLSPELQELDPANRWLARGPRFRLSAEFIRDQALEVSGLLIPKLGGPSVRPYHPPGLYEQVVAGSSASTYVVGQGDDLFRRTLYTYWKRSVPNPAMLLFDMPFRETCTLRRPRTNTPLQALNLLNDPTYVEAARGLAELAMQHGGSTPEARLEYLFRRVLVRSPRATEQKVLRAAWQRWLTEFRADPAAAGQWLSVGTKGSTASLDRSELAAYAAVASTVLNLDETITKQ